MEQPVESYATYHSLCGQEHSSTSNTIHKNGWRRPTQVHPFRESPKPKLPPAGMGACRCGSTIAWRASRRASLAWPAACSTASKLHAHARPPPKCAARGSPPTMGAGIPVPGAFMAPRPTGLACGRRGLPQRARWQHHAPGTSGTTSSLGGKCASAVVTCTRSGGVIPFPNQWNPLAGRTRHIGLYAGCTPLRKVYITQATEAALHPLNRDIPQMNHNVQHDHHA